MKFQNNHPCKKRGRPKLNDEVRRSSRIIPLTTKVTMKFDDLIRNEADKKGIFLSEMLELYQNAYVEREEGGKTSEIKVDWRDFYSIFVLELEKELIKQSSEKRNRVVSSVEMIFEIKKKNFINENDCKSLLEELKNLESSIPISKFLTLVELFFFDRSSENTTFQCSKKIFDRILSLLYRNLKKNLEDSWWFIRGEKDLSYLSKDLILSPYTKKVISRIETKELDRIADDFFKSLPENWPRWIKTEEHNGRKMLISDNVISHNLEVFWMLANNLTDLIRYELWEGMISYLIEKFGMSYELTISKKSRELIDKTKKDVYSEKLGQKKLPRVFIPIINEIFSKINCLR